MRGRWHSLEWSPLILCLQSSAATSIDRCVQHWALRVMCVWSLVHEHLFSSVVAPLPYWGRSSRSHNKRNPKNRLIVNHRWLPALKDELLPPRPLCNKGNAEGSAGTSWLLRGTCVVLLCCQEWVGCPLLCAGQSHSLISSIYNLSNSTIVRGNKSHHYILAEHICTTDVVGISLVGSYCCAHLSSHEDSPMGVPPIPTCEPPVCVVPMSGCKRKNLQFSRTSLF